MREADHLRPLVKDNAWLFGEDWRRSRFGISLTNILRAVADTVIAWRKWYSSHL
jgi:hypothetical protein